MQLNGIQIKQLHHALLSAFPQLASLEFFVRTELEENLSAIALGSSLSEVVFHLIEWARAHGRLADLVEKAYHENRLNPDLRAFVGTFPDLFATRTNDTGAVVESRTDPDTMKVQAQSLYSVADNEVNLQFLLKQLEITGSVIPFVGAGLSIPLGFPGWYDFLMEQSEKTDDPRSIQQKLDRGHYEEATAELLSQRGYRAFYDAILVTYGAHKLEGKSITGALKILPHLTRGPVVATHWDHVLEKAFEQANLPFDQVVRGGKADFSIQGLDLSRRLLLKIEGDVEDSANLILTESDYRSAYGGTDGTSIDFSKPLPRLLRQMLTGRSLLFLGSNVYSDRMSWLLNEVIGTSRSIVHYAIVQEPARKAVYNNCVRILGDHNIRPIWYPNGHHELMETILRRLASNISTVQTGDDTKTGSV